MRRRTLTDLANNPDLISGIYNYCDRWCERCPLTSRCLVYATEQEDNDSFENHDLRNEVFWQKLGAIFQETREMIVEWANEAGFDLNGHSDDDETRHPRKKQLVDNHPLTKAGKKYANTASDWFRELDQRIDSENSERSAKVALIGIDRSIAAWRLMQLSLPERAGSIVLLILQLERLRQRLEKSFPDARSFIRPGFDG
jgi:hypothetical protein